MIERARKLAPNEEVIVDQLRADPHPAGAGALRRRGLRRSRGRPRRRPGGRPEGSDQPRPARAHPEVAGRSGSRAQAGRSAPSSTNRPAPRRSRSSRRISYEEEDLIAAGEALETALKLDPSRKAALQSFREKLEKEAKIESAWYRAERGAFVVKYDDQQFKDVGETVLGYLDAAEARARGDVRTGPVAPRDARPLRAAGLHGDHRRARMGRRTLRREDPPPGPQLRRQQGVDPAHDRARVHAPRRPRAQPQVPGLAQRRPRPDRRGEAAPNRLATCCDPRRNRDP